MLNSSRNVFRYIFFTLENEIYELMIITKVESGKSSKTSQYSRKCRCLIRLPCYSAALNKMNFGSNVVERVVNCKYRFR
jgi:hypothetical protein